MRSTRANNMDKINLLIFDEKDVCFDSPFFSSIAEVSESSDLYFVIFTYITSIKNFIVKICGL
jgi:hypothetical protein